MKLAMGNGWGDRGLSDIALAVSVLAIVSMMILPLPTALLDVLIAGNISIGVLLLMTAMYVTRGVDFASFPTVLLLTTLYRLALNVASTRLILLHADGGDVIGAFGDFVVQGNFVVGAVVFLILTLIQFLVIAKGSERVAEVGARFSLDAMPGKQMSIDAELRAGAISQDEARQRRRLLERESQFYGAMDGAMKFVKGDAIAGIVITLINLVGGTIIGVFMHDLSAGQSLQTFGLLTIGDGLVSQIPALLISTAAGLVVTRVASAEDGGSLGRDVSKQVFGDPRAILVAGAFLLLLAIVPGMPSVPFLVLSAALLALGWRLRRASTAGVSLTSSSDAGAPSAAQAAEAGRVPLVLPLAIELGPRAATALTEQGEDGPLASSVAALRDELFITLGLAIPAPRIRVREDAPPLHIEVFIQEVPSGEMTLDLDEASPRRSALTFLAARIRERGADFLGLQETQAMLDRLDRAYPALVRNVVPKPAPLALLADILRRLVEEGVSVRPLREILEALALHAPTERDPVELTELVRAALRRAISHAHAREGVVYVHMVDPSIEDAIRESIRRTPSGSYLAMRPELARDIIESAKELARESSEPRLLLLTQVDVRRYLRRLLEADVPSSIVLSYAELAPGVMVEPRGRLCP